MVEKKVTVQLKILHDGAKLPPYLICKSNYQVKNPLPGKVILR